jgi:hypothetical protein
VAAELGISLPLTLGDSRVRTLAGVSSGPITLGQLRGKSAVPPLTANGVNASQMVVTSNSQGGTASCSPSVTASGGAGPYTYQWAFTSNPSSFTLSNGTSAICSISRGYTRNQTGIISATLQCTVGDSGGRSAVVTGITGTLDFEV